MKPPPPKMCWYMKLMQNVPCVLQIILKNVFKPEKYFSTWLQLKTEIPA